MKTEGNRDWLAYAEAKKNYLAVGKRYSAVLTSIMKLDPNILRVAEEILMTGDGLSAHDNRFLTGFYNDLKSKSKIDKKYYDLLLELKKTRNELDHATHELSTRRVNYLLRKSGIPPKRTNESRDAIASHINNPELGLLEKLSLPDVLDTQTAENLEMLIASGAINSVDGTLLPKTREAREFIKNLETGIKQKVNNDYFLTNGGNLLAKFHKLDVTNILEFIRISADTEHVREIERKLESGDIRLDGNSITPVTVKGKKYLALLIEELSAGLHRKVRDQLLAKNQKQAENDPRITSVTRNLADLDIRAKNHQRLSSLARDMDPVDKLMKRAGKSSSKVREALADLLTLQQTIASSFVDIKKQLIAVVDKKQVNIDSIITLMLAVKYLSVYETRYEKKLNVIESMLGITSPVNGVSTGPETISRLAERYGDLENEEGDETNAMIREILMKRLASRRELGTDANETIIGFMEGTPEVREFKKIISMQRVARKHIVDTLYREDCLYRGLGNMSELLAEITELEIEKKEKLADLIHEMELAHKEIWLSKIATSNGHYIDTNFADLTSEAKSRAKVANKTSIGSARQEIRSTLLKYRQDHQSHSDEFAKILRKSLGEIAKGGDVVKISKELSAKYLSMSSSHEKLMMDMEKDIILLEKRLLDFEEKTPKEIEKMLISDIRANI